MTEIKIVVIEDEAELREFITDTLEFADYEVFAAANGRMGIELVEQEQPDLILCDVMMPELDGYGVLLHLNQHPQLSRIPFIYLTARTARADVRKGMSMGADDYLTKPFTSLELLNAVEARLQKYRSMKIVDNDLERKQLHDYLNLTLPHELRTPLSGIILYLQMAVRRLEMGEGADSAIHMLNNAEKSANRLNELIERYLTYANVRAIATDRVLRAKLNQYRLPIDLRDIIVQEAQTQADAQQRVSDVQLDVVSGRATILHAHMHRLVGEMVSNALKFSEPGTPVVVRGAIESDFYCLAIENTGRGMTEEQIANVGVNVQFDRDFYEQQGAGLGLMIIKHIAETYEGSWELKSVPTAQTTLTVRLPIAAES